MVNITLISSRQTQPFISFLSVDLRLESRVHARFLLDVVKKILPHVCIALITLGCKQNSVGPTILDPRTYSWSIDSLRLDATQYPGTPYQILMESFWGTATNLYTVGWSGSAGAMWNFDGQRWKNVKLGLFEGGQIPAAYNILSIGGVTSDNVFAVGSRVVADNDGASFVIHYDGKSWKEQSTPAGNRLLSVWANSGSDVWACGLNGTLLHYDGLQWSRDSLGIVMPPQLRFILGSVARASTGQMFMIGSASESMPTGLLRWTYYFFRREAARWTLIDTFARNQGERSGKWGGTKLVVLPSGTMYSIDYYGVFRWDGTAWIKVYDNIKNLYGVFGTKDNDLFVTGDHGLLVYYDGSTWFEYPPLVQGVIYAGGWADNKQCFVAGWINGIDTIILWGK